MEIVVNRDDLLKGLQRMQGVVDKRQTMPVLSMIRVTPTVDTLILEATDLEAALQIAIPLLSPYEGPSFLMPARKSLDIFRSLPEGASVKLILEEEAVILRAGHSRFRLSTMDPAGFPAPHEFKFSGELTITSEALRLLLEQVAFAMAQQDVRYYLNGLLLEFSEKGVRAVATDGHRLAVYELSGTVNNTLQHKVIVPRKAVVEILRLLPEENVDITLSLSANMLSLRAPALQFMTKLIEGKYPDYGRLLQETGNPAFIEREPFKQMLQRASVVVTERTRGAWFCFEEGRLCVKVRNQERDESEEWLAVDYHGPAVEIGFNLSYILEYVQLSRAKMLTWWVAGSDVMAGLVAEGSARYVVMPMRL